jgi:hypothetical protein
MLCYPGQCGSGQSNQFEFAKTTTSNAAFGEENLLRLLIDVDSLVNEEQQRDQYAEQQHETQLQMVRIANSIQQ